MIQGRFTLRPFAPHSLVLFFSLVLIAGFTLPGCTDRGSDGTTGDTGKKTESASTTPPTTSTPPGPISTGAGIPSIDPNAPIPALSTDLLDAFSTQLPALTAHRAAILQAERDALHGAMEDFRSKRNSPTTAGKKVGVVVPAIESRSLYAARSLTPPARSFSLIDSAEAADPSPSVLGNLQYTVIGLNAGRFLGAAMTDADVPAGGGTNTTPIEEKGRVAATITISAEPGRPPTAELTTTIAHPLLGLDAFSKVSFSGSFCPAADGSVTITVKYSSQGHAGTNGAITYDKQYEAVVKAVVGEDAAVVKEDYQLTHAEGDEIRARALGQGALNAAETHWKKGKCIKIVAASPGRVKPRATSRIPVAVVHARDGASVSANVTVHLSGGESVSPSVIPKTPGDLTHVAVDRDGASMTITLTAASRRGKDEKELTITTGGAVFKIEGGADEFHGTGIVCDFAKPFKVTGSGVTVTFTPSSEQAGTYAYSGNMSGFPVSGNGTYTVAYQDGAPVHMTGKGPGAVQTPVGTTSGDGSEEYDITPVSGGCPYSKLALD